LYIKPNPNPNSNPIEYWQHINSVICPTIIYSKFEIENFFGEFTSLRVDQSAT